MSFIHRGYRAAARGARVPSTTPYRARAAAPRARAVATHTCSRVVWSRRVRGALPARGRAGSTLKEHDDPTVVSDVQTNNNNNNITIPHDGWHMGLTKSEACHWHGRWGRATARPHPPYGPGPQPLISCAWPSDLRGSPLPAVALRGGRYSVAPRSPRMASASSG